MTATVESLYELILSAVEKERASLREGKNTMTPGLEAKVEELCCEVMALPEKNRTAFLPKLEALFDAFRQLGEQLIEERNAVIEKMDSVSLHRRANRAYQTSGAIKTDDTGESGE